MSEKESKLHTYKAKINKEEGFKSKTKMRNFTLIQDEPEEVGGTNEGPSPVEVLLSSLGGCLEIVISMVSKEHGHKLKDLELEIEGDLDPRGFLGEAKVPAGFQNIRVNIKKMEGVPEDKKAEILEEVEGRCPIEDTLNRSLEVKFEQ